MHATSANSGKGYSPSPVRVLGTDSFQPFQSENNKNIPVSSPPHPQSPLPVAEETIEIFRYDKANIEYYLHSHSKQKHAFMLKAIYQQIGIFFFFDALFRFNQTVTEKRGLRWAHKWNKSLSEFSNRFWNEVTAVLGLPFVLIVALLVQLLRSVIRTVASSELYTNWIKCTALCTSSSSSPYMYCYIGS